MAILAHMTNAIAGRYHAWTSGDRLRAARENMPGAPTQAEFAPLLGFSRNTVARYERDEPGATKPIVFIRWAEVTGYDRGWLEHGTPPEGGTPDTGAITRRYSAVLALAA